MSWKSSKWFALSRKTDDRHPGNPSRPRPVPREAAWLLAPRGRPSPAPARRGNSDRKPREVQTTRSRGCGARRPQPFGVQDLERGGKADKKTNRGAHVFQKANATPGRSFSRPLRARGVRRPRDVAAGVACGGGRRHVASALRGRARAGLRPLQLEREPEPGVAGAGAGVRAGARPGCSAAWQRHGPSCSRDLSGRVGTYSNVVVRPASTLEAAPTRRKRPPRNFFSLRTRKKFRAATR